MKYDGTMKVNKHVADHLENACKTPLPDVGRNEVLFDVEYVFPNNIRMAIQVITSGEPNEEPAWTQGVLFDENGNELGCTDAGDSFIGEYVVWNQKDEYVVNVEIECREKRLERVLKDARAFISASVVYVSDKEIIARQAQQRQILSIIDTALASR